MSQLKLKFPLTISLIVLLCTFCLTSRGSELTFEQGKTEVDSLLKICSLYQNKQVDSMVYYGLEAFKLSQNINYKEGIRDAGYLSGKAYIKKLDYQSALKYLQHSLTYTDTIAEPLVAANIINNLGIVHHLSGDIDKALNYYQRAINHTTEDSEVKAKLLYNMGIISAEKDSLEKSAYYFHKAYLVALEVELVDKTLKPHIQANLAEVYSQLGEEFLAQRAANMAIAETKRLEDAGLESSLYISLGSTYRSLGNFKEAERLLKDAIVTAQVVNDIRREQEAYRFLVITYREQGRYAKALSAYERYNELKDSTFTIEANRQILELEKKFDSEKKLQEIKLLQREAELSKEQLIRWRMRNYFLLSITGIMLFSFILLYRALKQKSSINKSLVKSQSELSESNKIKSNLIRIIGHDLKGPIGSVTGFTELLMRAGNKNQTEKIKQYSEIIHNTSIGISQLLDNILYWARLQQGGFELKPSLFDIQQVIKSSIDPYMGMAENKNISLSLKIQDEIKAYGDPFTLSIIIGNLVNNAIKFSNPGCLIEVLASYQGQTVNFEVRDQGVGMSRSQLDKLFDQSEFNSTLGTGEEKGTGLGLKICSEFVELNNGEIKVESKPGMGTRFLFSFPAQSGYL